MGMWRWRLMIFIHLTWIYTQEYSPSANYDCWIHGYCYAPLGIYAWGDCCWASHIFTPQPTDENAPEWGQLIFDQYQLCWTSKLTTSKVHSTLSSTTITVVWLMQLRQLAMNIAGKKRNNASLNLAIFYSIYLFVLVPRMFRILWCTVSL